MMEFDASWCITCDKLIEPKRYQVPIPPPPPQSPAPPPSSPQSSPTKANSKKAKGGPRRGGLIHGTGRVKPNGTLKTAEPTPPPPPPPQPTRFRTVIDQSPQGIYCSDECKMADLQSAHAGLPTHPDRDPRSAQPSPTPTRAPSPVASSSSSSSESEDENPKGRQYHPSILQMAKNYNFPPLPDLNKIYIDDSSDSDCYHGPNEYTGGIMMAGRRIQATCPKPRAIPVSRYDPVEPLPAKIPGWTDGSQAWRASAYNIGPIPIEPDNFRHIKSSGSSRRPRVSPQERSVDPTQELMANFSECLTRRTESRLSSSPISASPIPKRERSLLMPGAEGKLLVPDVKLKVRPASSASLCSGWTSPTSSSRRSVRSPLSASSGDEPPTSFPLRAKRPAPETRSWSYDNVKTYPTMPLPTRTVKEKRIQIIDGEEVEVTVEVQKPPQRLFLFPSPVRA